MVTGIQSNTTNTIVPVKQELILDSTWALRETKSKQPRNEEAWLLYKIVKGIRNKNVIISKPDKGNSVVILDQSEYLRRLEVMLREGDYTELRSNPVNKMKNNLHGIIKKHVNVILVNPHSKIALLL